MKHLMLPPISRRKWLKAAGAITLAATGADSGAVAAAGDDADPEVVTLNQHRQLLLDDSLVESRWGVVRTVHAAKKRPNPVLVADQPWEGSTVGQPVVQYSTQAKRFQIWYYAGVPYQKLMTCFAESEDGIHWDKPNLGVFEHDGSKQNNIIMPRNSQGWFMLDVAEQDPARRYKGLEEVGRRFRTMYSADGIRWTKGEMVGGMLQEDDSPGLFYDWDHKRYVFVKRKLAGEHRRMIQTAFSDDFTNWKLNPFIFAPDEADAQRAVRRGVQRMDFYGLSAIPYEGFYLGWVNCFYLWRMNPGQRRIFHDGTIAPELVWSRDAVHWNRAEPGRAVIPRGPAGAFDHGMLSASMSPLVRGDELWVYYTGASCTHGCGAPMDQGPAPGHAHPDTGTRKNAIGLARWRLDRFVSLDADHAVRSVITKPLDFSGKSLVINANASGGFLQVELQDAAGKAIKGYEAANCKRFSGDELAHRVQWAEHLELPETRPLRLRFAMRNASLFSFAIR